MMILCIRCTIITHGGQILTRQTLLRVHELRVAVFKRCRPSKMWGRHKMLASQRSGWRCSAASEQGSNTCGPAPSLLARAKAVHSISPSSLMRPDHTTRSHGFFLLVLRFAERLTARERGAGIRHIPDVSLSPPQFCKYAR